MEVLVIVPIILAFWLVAFIQRSFESKAAAEKRAQRPKSALEHADFGNKKTHGFAQNPATGLPMLPNSMIDAGGNPLGTTKD